MGNLDAAFAEAQLLADRATRDARNSPHDLLPSPVGIDGVDEDDTVPCFDPWLIFKSEPNRERAARHSLIREGFECWYPVGRKMRPMPRRRISSKTRHKKRHVVLEDVRLPFPGYLFARRMTDRSHALALSRAWELHGVLGICMFEDRIACAEHYEIQLMQAKEDLGLYDDWQLSMNATQYALADVRRSDAARERWETPPKVIGSLDTNRHGSLHLVEAFGRITRIVSRTGNIPLRR